MPSAPNDMMPALASARRGCRHPEHHRLEAAHQPAREAEADQRARDGQGRDVLRRSRTAASRARRRRAAPPGRGAGRSGRAARRAAAGTARRRTDRPRSAGRARSRSGRCRRPGAARRPRSPRERSTTGNSRERRAPGRRERCRRVRSAAELWTGGHDGRTSFPRGLPRGPAKMVSAARVIDQG